MKILRVNAPITSPIPTSAPIKPVNQILLILKISVYIIFVRSFPFPPKGERGRTGGLLLNLITLQR